MNTSLVLSLMLTCLALGCEANYSSPDFQLNFRITKPRAEARCQRRRKIFFADKTFARNWTASRDYCRHFGMQLAEVTSANQTSALNLAWNPDEFDADYWTAGRDAQEISQFRWDTSGQAPSPTYVELISQTGLPYQTCLLFVALPENTSGFRYWACEDNRFAGVICEIRNI